MPIGPVVSLTSRPYRADGWTIRHRGLCQVMHTLGAVGHAGPMTDQHRYVLTATWTGNRGTGTSGYRDYDRTVTVAVDASLDRRAVSPHIFGVNFGSSAQAAQLRWPARR